MNQLIILTGYRLLAQGVQWILPIIGWFVPKVRQWRRIRADVWQIRPPEGRQVIWMHCSSLGEFEQGRPVWEGIRELYPDAWLLLSFFSHSGYARQKDNPTADRVVCLPLDTPPNALRWMDHFHPDLILWVKYDFWYHYWMEANRRDIPIILFAARFRSDQFLARQWARPFREIILRAATLAVQDDSSRELLQSWGAKDPMLAGDTRIDRVLDIADSPYHDPWIEEFAAGQRVMIGGSVWDEDLDLLLPILQEQVLSGWKWILAPHDLAADRIQRILKAWPDASVAYTDRDDHDPAGCQVLVLDTIGMLNKVYRWAAITYVGGGFGKSVHSLLEPAAYGVPVLFGPRHQKFPEAAGLIRAGGGFEVNDLSEVRKCLSDLGQESTRLVAGRSARHWLDRHQGATRLILSECQAILRE